TLATHDVVSFSSIMFILLKGPLHSGRTKEPRILARLDASAGRHYPGHVLVERYARTEIDDYLAVVKMSTRAAAVDLRQQVKTLKLTSDQDAIYHFVVAAFEPVAYIAIQAGFAPMHFPLQRHQEFRPTIDDAQSSSRRAGRVELDLRI